MELAIHPDVFLFKILNLRELMPVTLILVVTVTLGIIRIVSARLSSSPRQSRQLSPPPGPPGLPFIGNVFDIPQECSWVTYRNFAATYGDVIGVKALSQTLIILNSLTATIDLLDKRSAIYSDRPVSIVSQMIGWTRNLAFKSYGNDWRAMRRMLWQHIQPGIVAQYQPSQRHCVAILLKRLSEDSSDLDKQMKSYSCTVLLNVMYGLHVDHADIPRYAEILSWLESAIAEAFQPGAFLVEFIPWLRYVPDWLLGTRWKEKVLKWRRLLDALVEEPYVAAMEAMRRGEAETSMLSQEMESITRQEADASGVEIIDNLIKETASSAFHAGADALAATLHAFVCAMMLNPEVQVHAQEELDRVVGCDRLPEHFDRPSLPYVEAILKETYRWYNPVPLGVAHRCMEDNVYRGWTIPKGATVMYNVWAIFRDEHLFPKPDVFFPGRYLQDGKLNMDGLQPEILAFGVGRRTCPGKHLADDTLFISIASILHVYNITKALDAKGVPIPAKAEVASGFLSVIKKFDCSFQPRSSAHAALAQEA
ncbi:cytochrome P450 [Cubamyces sp. BRFM 1775]|nr:cytochrome P450 [Cubamyces sp. BRFM 1775]